MPVDITLDSTNSGITTLFSNKIISIPLGTLLPNMTLIRVRISIYFQLFDVHSYFNIGLDGVN